MRFMKRGADQGVAMKGRDLCSVDTGLLPLTIFSFCFSSLARMRSDEAQQRGKGVSGGDVDEEGGGVDSGGAHG